ncbi:MAG: iron-containing alcohol dehydrogenase [Clostridium sp.]|jgi:alcohol dehydrogenase class IV|uniref:iron-containing alcohol dehydrogenase n=1 Tax=Clostridium sp. TaxID=1506 RepID=UPI0025BE8B8F|nr:iron-containing alcohol dehydrogenase [Clostridium sp.]MCH3965759.1 iron-containing alcohol dehydrogenase [Clostridium sp.]MCI1717168.1 iron-containing alcohol dehydrogenase [Clostridium sp.]MCI1801508.1 iron-containing alcohol dehydrogenase [Clostridium sp.]MCI1815361.1 iron-containing alcohol dehydrogenase [Clostridium sp.]MCI1872264.1 iron-containing alcohol dehydrogenase [Clostridium sp.]
MKFNYYLPVNLVFGSGKIEVLGEETAKYGKKAFIVTGRNSTRKTGLLDRSIKLLDKAGIEYVVFDKVTNNPLTTTVEQGAGLAVEAGCDVVVGIGGGSIMDAAKAIAFSVKNRGDISDYIFGRIYGKTALPIVLVPTTAGTGSEGNNFAVLTNPENGDKKSLRTGAIYAKVSIIDPELMMTMPKSIIASVGFDALTHNIEAYVSRISQPITDMQALYGMKLLSENLVKVYNDPEDIEAWEKVTLASTLGGMVIGVSGVAAAHALEHPVSGLKNVVHGRGLAALMPDVVKRSFEYAPEKFGVVSKILGGKNESDCSEVIRKLLEKIELNVNLSDLGVSSDDVEWMAENCMKVSMASLKNNPKQFDYEEIKEIYYACI